MNYTYTYLYCILLLGLFSQPLLAQYQRKLPGFYSEVVYRKTDGKLYAIGYDPNGDPAKQFLVRIDPRATTVEKLVDFPNVLVVLALSSNEAYLYVGMDSIHRFNLNLKKFDQHFAPQFTTTAEKHRCHKIVSIPGQDEVIVAYWEAPNERETATIYAKGIRYGNVFTSPSRSNPITTNGKNLYFYEAPTRYAPILQVSIDANGLQLQKNKYHYLLEDVNSIQYDEGRLYASDGTVVQVKDEENLTLLGRFSTRASSMAIVSPSKLDTVYAQAVKGKEIWLQKFHRTNFQLLSEEFLSTINTEQTIEQVIPLGTSREFVAIASGQLYLVNRCIPQHPQAPAFEKSVFPACYGDTLRISAPGNFPAERYFWSNGFRGKTFVYPVNNTNPLSLSYQIADEQGCMSAASVPSEIRYVNLTISPPQVQSRFDQAVICIGGELELSAVETDGRYERFQKYLWSNGQTGRTIKVNQPGSYACRIQSKEGCYTGFSPSFQVKKAESPHPGKPTLSITGGDGDKMICSKDSAAIRTMEGFALYIWSDNHQSTAHQRLLPLTVESIAVSVKNSAGCISEAADVLTWSYATTPVQPSIQRSSELLASSAAEGNQWFFNGAAIPGANQQYLKIVEKGTYTVQVSKVPACPSLLSKPFVVN